MASPAITLTATLEDFTGAAVGSVANPAKICIALCGYGPELPRIAGAGMIARPGPIYIESTDGAISTAIWGNDQITPQNTYYTISLLDGQGNVVQCASYQFTGSGTFDLSDLSPNVPPYGFTLSALRYLNCTGSLVGGNRTFTAPGPIVAATYNGVFLGGPTDALGCTITGNVVLLNFDPELGDRIDALCIA